MSPPDCYCTEYGGRHPHAILFNILSQKETNDLRNWDYYTTSHNCHCEQRRLVCLRNPESTCQAASAVLVKTVRFMKSLPSFHHLPRGDQTLLLRSCWVPLFILGLAQERIAFEVMDLPANSILRKILLNDQESHSERETEDCPPTLAGVHNLKLCLNKLLSLDLSPKEYAYLKGALLFNPEIRGLRSTTLIEGLQKEALRVLQEVIHTLYPNNRDRFTQILLTASSLQTIAKSLVSELFFRPIIGQMDLLELLNEILFTK
ncbi:nuclear receptor subfamily 0, group B, member 2b [Chanos chanos]|uniref:Nuclear receptor subfamily 0, group B, member 2b n=1 Tax=Chanos chanos TaxID=29144 RepID=A0A6J2WK03_CHACN|nr:nuclear receptor subfamily 0 group B member 2-like [Chanos chanos]